MGPAELAGLVAREAEAGVAAVLAATEAPGMFVLERVVGRVGTRAPGAPSRTGDDEQWQAEFHLRHDPRTHLVPAPPGQVSARLATLPVTAVRGVGPAWAIRLGAHGIRSVGDLAAASPATVATWVVTHGRTVLTLTARARACARPWPRVDRHDRRSVLAVAGADPGDLESVPLGSRVDAVALWGHCVALTAALDDDVLSGIAVGGT
ncbi:MAG: hypothetical protein ACRCZD_18830 [Phycicoccus sp.]